MSECESKMGNMSTVSSRHTGAAVIWSEVGWHGDMMEGDLMCPDTRGEGGGPNKATVTQKLCLYINVEPEPAL